QLRALPARGPEIVSCVWQVESILGGRLGIELPAPPSTAAEGATWSRAIAEAVSVPGAPPTSYDLGFRAGAAELAVDAAARLWSLFATAPHHVVLGERAAKLREVLQSTAATPAANADTPTARDEDANITRELGAALGLLAKQPTEESAAALEQIRDRLRVSARVLESAAWGTPRQSVRAWHEKTMTGGELMRRLAEHQRWIVPCRVDDGRPAPRIFQFELR